MKQYFLLSFYLLFVSLFLTCKKKGDRLPLVTTLNASAASDSQINCGGVVYFQGDGQLLERGLCWSTSPEPTVDNNKVNAGSEEGNFSQSISGLLPNTAYYVRAFATSDLGTSYGETMSVTTLFGSTPTVIDYDGNVYKSIRIGSKIWTTENLKVTHYRNGDPISFGNMANTQGAYCYYENNPQSYKTLYGALYNWYAVSNYRSLAPAGWHVATYNDFQDLFQTLGGSYYAGAKMKAIHYTWNSNSNATNSSGYTALPGGRWNWSYGTFEYLTYNASFWTGTLYDSYLAYCVELNSHAANAYAPAIDVRCGLSVRLVKD